jgi:hypothetical protein
LALSSSAVAITTTIAATMVATAESEAGAANCSGRSISNAPARLRQANAAAGGPLMTPDELNDEFGF